MLKRIVLAVLVLFLVGALPLGGLVQQSYAQDTGREPVKAARQALSVPEIIEALISFPGWDSPRLGTGPCLRAVGWGEIVLKRQGTNEVQAMSSYLGYPERISYQTLKVAGPIVRYATTVNVCDASANRAEGGCDSIVEWEIEVVSKVRL